MFRLIAINFSQKSPHFSLLSPTSPCELSEREVTSLSNLKVVRVLQWTIFYLCHLFRCDNYNGLYFTFAICSGVITTMDYILPLPFVQV
jgi:hypothetical protein